MSAVIEQRQAVRVDAEQKKFARDVGARVRQLREERDWERADLAREADVKVSLIRDTEQGVSRLTIDNAFKIAKALGVAVDDLYPTKDTRATTHPRGRPKKSDG